MAKIHSYGPRGGKASKLHPQPVRFDEEETALIDEIRKHTRPHISVSFIAKRALRFAAPKILSGEVSLFDQSPGAPVTMESRGLQKSKLF